MNCDTAFDLIIDADGSRSLALARHLDDCPRCRQMQETLAPALEFLAPSGHDDDGALTVTPFTAGGAGSRPSFVTTEALQIARQAATRLKSQVESPLVRLQRIVGKSLRYAAVFAAGLLLAFTLFDMRPGRVSDNEKCTRQEAARDDAQRTRAEVRALTLSCAVCHEALERPVEHRSSSLEMRRIDDWKWLQEVLRDETLVVDSDRVPLPWSRYLS
jgi:hypothetical protein